MNRPRDDEITYYGWRLMMIIIIIIINSLIIAKTKTGGRIT